MSSSQEPSYSHVDDHLEPINPIQESPTPIQANQELCQESSLKHVETSTPYPNQDLNTLSNSILDSIPSYDQPIHNLYLFYDQDIIYDQDPTHEQEIQISHIHNSLNPIHNPTKNSPIHPPTSPIHYPETSTSLDEILGPQENIGNQILTEPNVDQHPHDHSPSSIDPIPNRSSYALGSNTFIHGGCLVGDKELLSTTLPSPSNNGIASCVLNNKYPVAHPMVQNMNYHGKGLGLHEQGILEPIHFNIPPRSYGLGYIPQGKQSQDVGTTSMPSKSTSFHPKSHASHCTTKTYVSIPPPSSHKSQKHVTIHLSPSTLPPILPTPNIPIPHIPLSFYPHHFCFLFFFLRCDIG